MPAQQQPTEQGQHQHDHGPADRFDVLVQRAFCALAAEANRQRHEEHTLAAPERHARLCDGLRTLYAERLRATGRAADAALRDLLALDIELNAQGMAVWLDRAAR